MRYGDYVNKTVRILTPKKFEFKNLTLFNVRKLF